MWLAPAATVTTALDDMITEYGFNLAIYDGVGEDDEEEDEEEE